MPHLPRYALIRGPCFIRLPVVIANKLIMQPHSPCHADCCQHETAHHKAGNSEPPFSRYPQDSHRSAIGAANAHFFIGMGWENEGRLINAFKGSY